MNRKRERLEIILDILKAIKEREINVRPTHILYKSNLSHKMLTEYLSELREKRFASDVKDGKGKMTYSLTEKGFSFIKEFSMIRAFMESYDLG